MSNFEKVVDFNKKFNLKRYTTLNKDILEKDKDLVKFRLDLILEEVDELREAIQTNDLPEVVDALSDILYVVYGMGDCLGINLDETFNLVHESNMSKLCSSEEEAIQTVNKYNKEIEMGKSPYDSPAVKKGDGDYWIVYNKSTGKVLKNINYNAVDFSSYK